MMEAGLGHRVGLGGPIARPASDLAQFLSLKAFANPPLTPLHPGTIQNVTFGAGLSYISSPRTPFPVRGHSPPARSTSRAGTPGSLGVSEAPGHGDNVLCLSLPDMP